MELDEKQLDNVMGGFYNSSKIDDVMITNIINRLKKDGEIVSTESVLNEISKICPIINPDLEMHISDIITINKGR